MVKQLRTLYWSTFEVKAFQLHNQEYTVGKKSRGQTDDIFNSYYFSAIFYNYLLICCSNPLTRAQSDS